MPEDQFGITDEQFDELLVGEVPPHTHPEYYSFGQHGFAQTLPVFAGNSTLPSDSTEKMIAVHLTLPAEQECQAVWVAANPNSSLSGTWRAGIYLESGGSFLPLGVTTPQPGNSSNWWYGPLIQPIAAADEARAVWVVIERTNMVGMRLLMHSPYAPHVLDGLCYTTTGTSLPARLEIAGWDMASLIPIVALA